MATVYTDEKPAPFISMNTRQFIVIALIGAVVGIAAWGLTILLNSYVYQAVLCHGNGSKCNMSFLYASITTNILAAAVGLFGLVRMQIFRPLLIVLAAMAALWSSVVIVAALPWYLVATCCLVLYALAYALFAWIARIRSFLLAAVIVIVLVVVVRLILNS
ncbi:MAG: hypothetical protein ACHQTE_02340 [Candidatus Saccharimonadales bacterium]